MIIINSKKARHIIWGTILLIIIFLFKYNVIKFVSGNSMLPTLHTGNLLVVNPWDKNLYLGDIIIFKKSSRTYVKRIIAMSGYYSYDPEYKMFTYFTPSQYDIIKNDKAMFVNVKFYPMGDAYWVMGDNNESENSEMYGPIQQEEIIGKVISTPPPVFLAKDGQTGKH